MIYKWLFPQSILSFSMQCKKAGPEIYDQHQKQKKHNFANNKTIKNESLIFIAV